MPAEEMYHNPLCSYQKRSLSCQGYSQYCELGADNNLLCEYIIGIYIKNHIQLVMLELLTIYKTMAI